MKKKSILLAAMVMCLMTCLSSCGDKPVMPTELPPTIQSFVQQTFPGQAISYAQKERSLLGSEYDVVLADGTEISFDRDNAWDKVDCKMQPVPAALVPAAIATHVQTNFPQTTIVKIDKEHNGFDIELNNNLELKFNEQGAFVKMDD